MIKDGSIFIGKGDLPQYLNLKYANRHGLITGATGTGKTVTLQSLAEGLSAQGVPVFVADVKGDLAGLSQSGLQGQGKNARLHPKLRARAAQVGLSAYEAKAFPVLFWDLFGRQGHPVRTSLSQMGPLLLSRILRLSEVQEGVLQIAFALADQEGLALLDMADLRALLTFMIENRDQVSRSYGHVTRASIGAIQRQLLSLERQGGGAFFGEPGLDIKDLMRGDVMGQGYISILAADELIRSSRLYATFLLWLLSELFEVLPEQGDADKPRLVFFFDEAHLLFDEAPQVLLEKVEQVVRLIRSKGVGVYFVTQNPLDVPEAVLGQLGNRVQHALRAFTPRDQKAVRAAAETFRPNPKFDAEDLIGVLGVGEALVSTLEKKAVPSIVERTLIRPPCSRMGSISDEERRVVKKASPVHGLYEKALNRESAAEILARRTQEVEDFDSEDERLFTRQHAYDQAWQDEPQTELQRRGGSTRRLSRRLSGRPVPTYDAQGSARRVRQGGFARDEGQSNLGGMLGILARALGADALGGAGSRTSSTPRRRTSGRKSGRSKSTRRHQTPTQAFAKSMMRAAGTQVGRQLARGLLGGFLRKRR